MSRATCSAVLISMMVGWSPAAAERQSAEQALHEAPPWEHVVPMAQRYVDMASAWLQGPGAHIVTIPEYIDYGGGCSGSSRSCGWPGER